MKYLHSPTKTVIEVQNDKYRILLQNNKWIINRCWFLLDFDLDYLTQMNEGDYQNHLLKVL